MPFEDIVKADGVLCNAAARSKKHCLEILSELLARSAPDLSSETIFESLIERERLGCTGLDDGAAFPHCRIDGVDSSVGALIKLSNPVDFDATDGDPIDLVFGLMVPTELDDSHRQQIRRVTDYLGDDDVRARLRAAGSSGELYDILIAAGEPTESPAETAEPAS